MKTTNIINHTKKTVIKSFAILLFLSGLVIPLHAENIPVPVTEGKFENSVVDQSQKSMQRINEINAMDKSALSHAEKRKLRKELKSISDRDSNGGIYLSVGAVIIILLLLILLL
ncbi:MAG: hypothetical protein ABI772_07005 [Bacteroidota bacterium]